ncbi:MAG: TetR/AcrR family transcriptional regulator [Promethearchaeota archaeon]
MESNSKETNKVELSTRDHIIRVATELIISKGYSNISMREIARKAKISAGTLFYHFKEGKSEILKILFKQAMDKLEAGKLFSVDDFDNFTEALKTILYRNIDNHRKFREFSAAIEIELISNIDYYLKLSEFIEPEIDIVIEPIIAAAKKFKKSNFNIEGKEKIILQAVDAIVHRHIYYRNMFGSDEDLVNLLMKIILAIAREES